MTARVAVLGTGKMGAALAERFAAAGNELTLWNRTRARAEQLKTGRVVASPAEAVAEADFVVSSLTGEEALRETFGGDRGALAAAHGQHFIEMSTGGPEVLAELQPRVLATGSALIDAPIVGAPTAVRAGAATILAGGSDGDVDHALSLLELCGEVRHVGPFGSGARAKLVANSMLGVVSLAAAELQVNGEAAGLDPEVVFELLSHHVPGLNMRRDGYLHEGQQPSLFALRDLRKDLDLALRMFHGVDGAVPVTGLARELTGEVAAEVPDGDISAVVRRYRRFGGAGV